MRLVSGARPSVLDLEDDGALRDRVRRAALTAAPARPRSAARRLSWRRGLLQRTPGIALVAGAATWPKPTGDASGLGSSPAAGSGAWKPIGATSFGASG